MGTTEGTTTDDLSALLARLEVAVLPPDVRADVDQLARWARQASAFLAVVTGTARALQVGPLAADLSSFG